MARKRKELPLLEKVTITDVAAEGKAIAKVNDLVIFVPYVVPGDVVDLQIKRKKHHYAEAEAVKFHEYSAVRAVPFCQHYGVCGGCKWQVLPYAVRDYAYQHNYSFINLRTHEGMLRNMIVRTSTTGELMVILICKIEKEEEMALFKQMLQYIADTFPEITSLLYIINNKCNDTITDLEVHTFKGKDHIFEEMEGLRFKVGPKSFYQTNSEQAYNLYKVARNFAGLTGNELVYDLYTGTGTIANFVSKHARQVIGIEYVPEAIEDAKVNAEINGIKNTLFFAGDMKDMLTQDFINQYGRPDVIITDPPRAGMHQDVVDVILFAEPKRIVYVSCNPATQARDLQLLDAKYKVKAVQPVDMFPHTHHVENVVLLELKD